MSLLASHWRDVTIGTGLLAAALAATALLLALLGANPLLAYGDILAGAFGSVSGLTEDLVYATPVILTSLSVILAFTCGLWNIGADGQLYLGAIAAVRLPKSPGKVLVRAVAAI